MVYMSSLRLAALLALCTAAAQAAEPVSVVAWGRATAPGATTAAIYGSFTNRTDRVLQAREIRFANAARAMVHSTEHQAGVARMRHAELRLAPGETEALAPGGKHIMLMGLSEPMQEHCSYEFTIVWQDGVETRHRSVTGSLGQMQAPAASLNDGTASPCR